MPKKKSQRRRPAAEAKKPQTQLVLQDLTTRELISVRGDLTVVLGPDDLPPGSTASLLEVGASDSMIEYMNSRGAKSVARRPSASLSSLAESGAEGQVLLVSMGKDDARGRRILHPMSLSDPGREDKRRPESLSDLSIRPVAPLEAAARASAGTGTAKPIAMPAQILRERVIAQNALVPARAESAPEPLPEPLEPAVEEKSEEPASEPLPPKEPIRSGPVRVRDLYTDIEHDIDASRGVALVPQGMIKKQSAWCLDMKDGPLIKYLVNRGEPRIAKLAVQPIGSFAVGQLVLIGVANDRNPEGLMAMHIAQILALPGNTRASSFLLKHLGTGATLSIAIETVVVPAPADLRPGSQPILVGVRPQVVEVDYERQSGTMARALLPRRQASQIEGDLMLLDRNERDKASHHVMSCYRRVGLGAAGPVPGGHGDAPTGALPRADGLTVLNLVTGQEVELESWLQVLKAPRNMDLGRPAMLIGIDGQATSFEYETLSGRPATASVPLMPIRSVLSPGTEVLIGSKRRDPQQRMLLDAVCLPTSRPVTGPAGNFRSLLAVRTTPADSTCPVQNLASSTAETANGAVLVVYAPADMDVAVPAALISEGRGTVVVEYTSRTGRTLQVSRPVLPLGSIKQGIVLLGTRAQDAAGRPIVHAADVRIGQPPLASPPSSPRPGNDRMQRLLRSIEGHQEGSPTEVAQEDTTSAETDTTTSSQAAQEESAEPSSQELPVTHPGPLDDAQEAPDGPSGLEEAGPPRAGQPDPGVLLFEPYEGGEPVEVLARRVCVLGPEDLDPSMELAMELGDNEVLLSYRALDGSDQTKLLPLIGVDQVPVGALILLPDRPVQEEGSTWSSRLLRLRPTPSGDRDADLVNA